MTRDASTERLLLEPWSDAYFEEFARVLQDPEAMRFISGGTPLPLDTIRSIARTDGCHLLTDRGSWINPSVIQLAHYRRLVIDATYLV